MISPVLYDRPFQIAIEHPQVNSFVLLGHARGNKGQTHVMFLRRSLPENGQFTVGDEVPMTGYCSYRYLSAQSKLIGVIFCTFTPRTECLPAQLSVTDRSNPPSKFEPTFSLENIGVIAFVSDDSSVLALPKIPHENAFLVKDTPNGSQKDR